jgi:hypothetical protein
MSFAGFHSVWTDEAGAPIEPDGANANGPSRRCETVRLPPLCYDAVAVMMPHIPLRQTQSISENPAIERRATWSVSVV